MGETKTARRTLLALSMAACVCFLLGWRDEGGMAEASALAKEPREPSPLALLQGLEVPDLAQAGPAGDAARYALQLGILDLAPDGTFAPDRPLTQGELAAALTRLGEREDRSGSGTEEITAEDPEAPVTRSGLALALWRYAKPRGYPAALSEPLDAYPDGDAVPAEAAEAFSWALGSGLFQSLTASCLCPNTAVSRLQLAQALAALERDRDPLARAVFQAQPLRSSASAAQARRDEIQQALEATARHYGAMGLQLAVVEDGAVTGTFAWGWATQGSDPLTPAHKLRTASLSKVEVALAAAILTEAGTVDPEESIGSYWGCTVQNPAYPESPISIDRLLSHTSSLRDPALDISTAYESVLYDLSTGAAFSPSREPGDLSSWSYNNYGFAVLGMTLELASGRTLDSILQERLFGPMDIDASFEAGELQDPALLSTLYRDDATVSRTVGLQLSQRARAPGASGANFAGGFTASAGDLAKLTALLASDGKYEGLRLLSEGSVARLERYEATPVSDGFYQAHPLRLRLNAYGRQRLYYHTGSAYGVYNCLSYDPDTGDGIVVLSNGASGVKDENGIYAVCGDLMEAVYPLLRSP